MSDEKEIAVRKFKMRLLKRIELYSIRKRLRLKQYEEFQIRNRRTDNTYCFTSYEVKRINRKGKISTSDVALKWLMNGGCKIIKTGRKVKQDEFSKTDSNLSC